MTNKNYIIQIFLEESGLPVPTPEIQHERNLAIYDILQDNEFAIDRKQGNALPQGPFVLRLVLRNSLLVFIIEAQETKKKYEIQLSLTPLRPVIKDYFEICKSYFNAVKRLPPSQIETIDMGRRAIHLEGSRVLMERLVGKVEMDVLTAKRIFTLICALHFK
jgi:uncharacterized protein (UPF0262 family)